MSKVKLNLIAAACENMGIGVNGTLPWRLKKEMNYFSNKTTKVTDPTKKNAVIMGRVTWDCIPDKYRPLGNRINIVLTRNVEKIKENVPNGVEVFQSLDEAISHIETRDDIESTWVIGGSSIYKVPNGVKVFQSLDEAISHIETRDDIESTWVIGGSSIWKAAMNHSNCDKIYLTEIQKNFECDTFFPTIDGASYQLVTEDGVPQDKQTEGDISYYFRVYKKL